MYFILSQNEELYIRIDERQNRNNNSQSATCWSLRCSPLKITITRKDQFDSIFCQSNVLTIRHLSWSRGFHWSLNKVDTNSCFSQVCTREVTSQMKSITCNESESYLQFTWVVAQIPTRWILIVLRIVIEANDGCFFRQIVTFAVLFTVSMFALSFTDMLIRVDQHFGKSANWDWRSKNNQKCSVLWIEPNSFSRRVSRSSGKKHVWK